MIKEEEIKARMENGYIITTRTYIGPVDTLRVDLAEEDVRHLLARNEELQRRVEKLEKALQFYARLDEDMIYDEIEEDHGRRAVEALAKEQDDD